MKRIKTVMTAALVVAAFAACQPTESEASKNASKLTAYVDSIQNLTPDYTSNTWASLDAGYQERILLMENEKEQLEAEDQAKLDASIAKYNALKASYEENIKLKEIALSDAKMDFRTNLRNALFGEGLIGSDMSFAFANANNLLDVYQKFVNSVDDNKKNYSREDWDEIEVLYEALDTRKNAVEKDLPQGHNNKIAGLKIKYSAIRATNRGGTKGEENEKAKDNS